MILSVEELVRLRTSDEPKEYSRAANEVVRQRIAYNKKTPQPIIERLAQDPVPLVQSAALKRLGARGS
jgi:hypothetical protein